MKVTLNWLKEYVDFDWSIEELSERLTMVGIEVEGINKIGGDFEGVVVAEVLSSEKHPNADKLSVCKVADGRSERQIVCGATNYKVGDKVPLALPGTTLPTPEGQPPFQIKTGRIRGVESHGMMCAPDELGLPGNSEGLMILPPGASVGQPFAEFLGRPGGDVVYDLEITPNRPDLNSVIGIAREISAATGNPLRIPEIDLPQPAATPAGTLVDVRVEDAELCPRYTARMVRGVSIGPSPDWLRSKLEKIGIRSISNVVDVTNYVMMETGQPLHAFDYHLLAKPEGSNHPSIVVRRAVENEKFVTLDGQERTLTNDMLLIADESKGIALAGIMGGRNSEIQPETRDVLIESASFKPSNIRATSKRLDLRTDSSYRFERGSDIEMADWASRRAAQLILQTAGGEIAGGVVDACPKPFQPRAISLRHGKVNELLGIHLSPTQNVEFLRRLGLETTDEAGGACSVRIPSFRVDLKRETDLIEEICRLHGVSNIPSTPPRGAIGTSEFDAVYDEIAAARRLLAGLGLNEAQGQTLISGADARRATGREPVLLSNPLSSDMNALRPSLLPGLIEALRHNLNHKTPDVALFEIGRVFTPAAESPLEERRLAIALTGNRNAAFWSGADRDARFDVFDLKGILEGFFEQFGLRGMTYSRADQPAGLYVESAAIQLGKFHLGELGQLHPALARQYDLRDPVWLAELNFDTLLARRIPARSFKPLPSHPSIRRDVALLVPADTAHDAVLSASKRAKPKDLESVDLFDVFRGKNVPEGQKSMAYAFTYRNPERTLTDAEVNATHEKLVESLKRELNATAR